MKLSSHPERSGRYGLPLLISALAAAGLSLPLSRLLVSDAPEDSSSVIVHSTRENVARITDSGQLTFSSGSSSPSSPPPRTSHRSSEGTSSELDDESSQPIQPGQPFEPSSSGSGNPSGDRSISAPFAPSGRTQERLRADSGHGVRRRRGQQECGPDDLEAAIDQFLDDVNDDLERKIQRLREIYEHSPVNYRQEIPVDYSGLADDIRALLLEREPQALGEYDSGLFWIGLRPGQYSEAYTPAYRLTESQHSQVGLIARLYRQVVALAARLFQGTHQDRLRIHVRQEGEALGNFLPSVEDLFLDNLAQLLRQIQTLASQKQPDVSVILQCLDALGRLMFDPSQNGPLIEIFEILLRFLEIRERSGITLEQRDQLIRSLHFLFGNLSVREPAIFSPEQSAGLRQTLQPLQDEVIHRQHLESLEDFVRNVEASPIDQFVRTVLCHEAFPYLVDFLETLRRERYPRFEPLKSAILNHLYRVRNSLLASPSDDPFKPSLDSVQDFIEEIEGMR